MKKLFKLVRVHISQKMHILGRIRFAKSMSGFRLAAMVEVGSGSPDGVAPIRMVSVSASVSLPLHHKVQKFSSGTGSPRWSQKKGRKTVVWLWCGLDSD